MKLIFKIFKKIRQAKNRDKHAFEMYKLNALSAMKQMQMELKITKKCLKEKDEELQVAKKELSKSVQLDKKLYKYAQLQFDADEMKVLIEKVQYIRDFMDENSTHISFRPEIKMNLGMDKNYTDTKENLLVNNMLRELNHDVTYNNFYTSYVDLYWNLEKAYRKIVKYEMRIDAINAQQSAINDQILKLGIVQGVNK